MCDNPGKILDGLKEHTQTLFVPNVEYEEVSTDFIDKPKINKKSPLSHICRWLAVIPGSVVCVILVMFPIHWAVMLIQFAFKNEIVNVEDPISLLARIPPEFLERSVCVLFTPMVLIVTGSKIAPKCKFQVGIAMAILWGLWFGFVTGMGVARIINMDWFLHSISFALGVAGCVIGLLLVYRKQRETLFIESLAETVEENLE